MADFTPVSGLLGGLLIGAASTLLLLLNGRIAGISGLLGGVLAPRGGDTAWRLLFLVGLVLGAALFQLASAAPLPVTIEAGWPAMIAGGLLVGIGTGMGGGCTSGHGVCGIARLSARSIVATATFMATGVATVFITHHVLGG